MKNKAQSTIEFTLVLIIIVLMVWGLIQIFRWSGMDLAERRWTHDQTLINGQTPEEQLNPDFYRAKRLNSVYRKAND
jgi:hypothetical protein